MDNLGMMKPKDQRKAIAKACGISEIGDDWWGWDIGDIESPEDIPFYVKVPDYLNCPNAMAKAERHLDDEQYLDFMCYLTEPNYARAQWSNLRQALEATPARRAEAFLRALGLWKAGT